MEAPWIRIVDLAPHEGQEVTLKGWIYNKRSSGKIHFLQIRDGSGFIQGVMERTAVPEETFQAAKGLWIEASVEVRGTVRRDERAPSGFELSVSDLVVVSNPVEEYPITKKEHGIDFLLDNRHLWLRSHRQQAILKIRTG